MVTDQIKFEMSWKIYRGYYSCPVHKINGTNLYAFNPWEVDTIAQELMNNMEENNSQKFSNKKKPNNLLTIGAGFFGSFHFVNIAFPTHVQDLGCFYKLVYSCKEMPVMLIGMLIQQLPIKLVTEDEVDETT